MTQSLLTLLGMMLAGAVSVALAAALDVTPWGAVPAVPITWYAISYLSRHLHAWWVRRCVRLEREGRRVPPRALPALGVAGRVQAVAAGEPGFSRETQPLAALERAVLLPWSPGDEAAAVEELRRARPETLRAIVQGLRSLQDEAVSALGRPFHVLFPDAHRLLGLIGHPTTWFFPRLRAERAWRRRRVFVDPEQPHPSLALRFLLAGMPDAALRMLPRTRPKDDHLRRLWTLARMLKLLREGENGTLALRPDEFAGWATELLLIAGRRLRDLVPGSPFLAAVPGGPAALERAVRNTPRVVEDLARLYEVVPELERPLCLVLAQILGRAPEAVSAALSSRALTSRVDRAVQAHLRGLALLQEGRPREALAEFEAVRERAPNFTPAIYSLARVHRTLSEPARGEAVLRRSVEDRPDDPDARLFLARFLAEGDEEQRARAVYDAALTRFPESASLRVAYAQDLLAWEDEAEACVHLEAAHEEHPDDPRLAFLAGRARVAVGRPEDAVGALRRACRLLQGRDQAEARFWLFSAYRDQGRHERALALVDGLVESLGSGQENLLEELAEYLEERHDFLRARAAIQRARDLRGDGW